MELDDEIMEIDSCPPTQVSQRPPDPIIKNSNNATSNSVDRRDEEINTYKKQVEELSSMVKKLIEENQRAPPSSSATQQVIFTI